MTQFVMAHPWMTFWLIVLLILTLDNAQGNFAKALSKRRKEKADQGEVS